MTERSVDTQADLRASSLWKGEKSVRSADERVSTGDVANDFGDLCCWRNSVRVSRGADRAVQRFSQVGVRFSRNASIPSAASRRNMFSTITCEANR
jgi:hypothetical protein